MLRGQHAKRGRRYAIVSTIVAAWLAIGACASNDSRATPPVNFVQVSERIDTSGQPGRPWLENAAGAGYEMVINLSPPGADGSIRDEPEILEDGGVEYVNIPVNWSGPTDDDFDRFRAALSSSASQRVLVHCQLNMRASAFTFLYRVIEEGEDPEAAWKKVTSVWVPEGRWRLYINDTLNRHGVAFRP